MLISVVIPAFNESGYLAATLRSLNEAKAKLNDQNVAAEIMVVDNDSDDSTAEVARKFDAIVINETIRNISKVRNAGAQASPGDVLVFIDADTVVPDKLLVRIAEIMSDPDCSGGAVDTDYQPRKPLIKLYLKFWRLLGKTFGMAQGAAQFCRRNVFVSLNGYDENLFMGEDVDFYWRLKKAGKVVFIDDLKVVPSSRRFDRWPIWRTLIWTNPLFVLLCQRRKNSWRGWYEAAPR